VTYGSSGVETLRARQTRTRASYFSTPRRPPRAGASAQSSWLPGTHSTLANRAQAMSRANSRCFAVSPTSPARMSQSSGRAVTAWNARRFSS
jgi:hypothetical protein